MPELPEVETVRRGLEKLVLNKKIKDIRVLYSKTIINEETEFIEKLTNKTIKKIDRRGKYLLFRFSSDLTMISHLRMEGKYFVEPSTKEVEKHTHVVFDFTDGTSLRYNDVRKFGRMQLVKTGMEIQTAGLAKLGPEPKEKTFIVEDFSKNLKPASYLQRSKQTLQAVHVCTHIVRFANFSEADFCKSLLGSIPNPLTIFSKSATLLRS